MGRAGCSSPKSGRAILDTSDKGLSHLKPNPRPFLAAGLRTLFGTPAEPTVGLSPVRLRDLIAAKEAELKKPGLKEELKEQLDSELAELKERTAEVELQQAIVTELGLEDDTLKQGGRLFRTYCQQCHGATGDGCGPSSTMLFPQPRTIGKAVQVHHHQTGHARRPAPAGRLTPHDPERPRRVGDDAVRGFVRGRDRRPGELRHPPQHPRRVRIPVVEARGRPNQGRGRGPGAGLVRARGHPEEGAADLAAVEHVAGGDRTRPVRDAGGPTAGRGPRARRVPGPTQGVCRLPRELRPVGRLSRSIPGVGWPGRAT